MTLTSISGNYRRMASTAILTSKDGTVRTSSITRLMAHKDADLARVWLGRMVSDGLLSPPVKVRQVYVWTITDAGRAWAESQVVRE